MGMVYKFGDAGAAAVDRAYLTRDKKPATDAATNEALATKKMLGSGPYLQDRKYWCVHEYY